MTAVVHRIAARLVVIIVLGAMLGACLDAPAPSVLPTPTREPDPTPAVTTYQLGTTVWYEGFLLHFDSAKATLDPRGGPVEVSLRAENPQPDDSQLDAPIRLVIGDLVVEPTRESQVPEVAADGIVGVVLTFEVNGAGSADSGVLTIGDDPLHIATVPLSDPKEAVAYQPVAVATNGTGAAGDLRLTLHGGELRWDLPDWSQELDASLEALTLTYDATYTGDFSGGFAFTADNVALRLPDGKVVTPRRDGHSQSIELIGPKKTKKNLFSRFEIPSGTTGQLALLVRNGSAEKAIPITIGG